MSALLDSLAEFGTALAPSRRAALERVRAEGLPTQRNERWKYTSLRALEPLATISPLGSVRLRDAGEILIAAPKQFFSKSVALLRRSRPGQCSHAA